MDLAGALVVWNDEPGGNVDHIAPTGLTREEVEAVIHDTRLPVERSRSTDRPCKLGTLPDGRRVFVAWDVESSDPPVVYPVTAYVVYR